MFTLLVQLATWPDVRLPPARHPCRQCAQCFGKHPSRGETLAEPSHPLLLSPPDDCSPVTPAPVAGSSFSLRTYGRIKQRPLIPTRLTWFDGDADLNLPRA